MVRQETEPNQTFDRTKMIAGQETCPRKAEGGDFVVQERLCDNRHALLLPVCCCDGLGSLLVAYAVDVNDIRRHFSPSVFIFSSSPVSQSSGILCPDNDSMSSRGAPFNV